MIGAEREREREREREIEIILRRSKWNSETREANLGNGVRVSRELFCKTFTLVIILVTLSDKDLDRLSIFAYMKHSLP